MSQPLGELGDRAMVRMDSRTVTLYRVEWEYNGFRHDPGCEEDGWYATWKHERRLRVKTFRSRTAAYRWMALRLIFAKRNELATRMGSKGYPEGCRLCDAEEASGRRAGIEDPQALCRYHDGEHFELLRTRLARWLRWRDAQLEITK